MDYGDGMLFGHKYTVPQLVVEPLPGGAKIAKFRVEGVAVLLAPAERFAELQEARIVQERGAIYVGVKNHRSGLARPALAKTTSVYVGETHLQTAAARINPARTRSWDLIVVLSALGDTDWIAEHANYLEARIAQQYHGRYHVEGNHTSAPYTSRAGWLQNEGLLTKWNHLLYALDPSLTLVAEPPAIWNTKRMACNLLEARVPDYELPARVLEYGDDDYVILAGSPARKPVESLVRRRGRKSWDWLASRGAIASVLVEGRLRQFFCQNTALADIPGNRNTLGAATVYTTGSTQQPRDRWIRVDTEWPW